MTDENNVIITDTNGKGKDSPLKENGELQPKIVSQIPYYTIMVLY